ncbi:type I-C CRISPR-associated protein Cas7/Csd2 [Acetivibrio straminisolvens]|jgi:CRISPR-associated protein Csd2|uniref:CRISPR-associated protein n=1 Tax=Acetivibrio straminisolvens JCM 21531 TaxID=1294263 RepID=W4V844_9FIRM|nr:type I-C CRISPR-associated protein Cas7/Csd2 [Acetivibrio straminisolvens]GAE89356.1 CRISPR-associated protein [Acetivibrio straminisolvens JCM 21531]
MSDLIKRYEFILFFDVENGNPNGDPDAGNMPRIDPETSHGIITDVCIKRKVRNYVDIAKNNEKHYEIYVQENAVLNNLNKLAYDELKIPQVSKKLPKDKEEAKKLTDYMCQRFFDIRTFGAVMTTDVNCGQVRGPVQFGFAKSIDPIVPQEISITRMAVTNEKDAEKERTMGRKHIVPYALYRMEGFISAPLARKTGFNTQDLEVLWDSLINMFDHDRSAARGKMSTRKLIIFEHSSELGNCSANKLFDLVDVERIDSSKPPRSYNDYLIKIDKTNLPEGVKCIEK